MPTEVHTAKLHEIFETNISNIGILYKKSMNKSRIDFLQKVVFAIIASRSVQYGEIADKMEGDADEDSKLRRIQRFMADYDLDYDLVLMFLLLMLPPKSRVNLVLDRTEWEFGGQNHNILVVSLYTHGIGFPIWFECLDNNGGNSCTDDRIYVLECCIKYLGKSRIKAVLGDCEFIGEEWVKYLLDLKITFFLDLRSNQYFTYNHKSHQISAYLKASKQKRILLDDVLIFNHRLSLALKKQPPSKKKRKDVLAILTNARACEALEAYRNRWSIEVLFENLKTRGFNLEDTHLKDPIRLRKLFALCAIAFALSFAVGLALNKIKPIPLKNHGYKENSFFRHGLNFIRKISKNIKKRTLFKQIKTNLNAVIQIILHNIQANFLLQQKIVM
jgi:Transposase DDE domain